MVLVILLCCRVGWGGVSFCPTVQKSLGFLAWILLFNISIVILFLKKVATELLLEFLMCDTQHFCF